MKDKARGKHYNAPKEIMMNYSADASEAAPTSQPPAAAKAELLRGLGMAVRTRRGECGLTLRALAKAANVSERFLVQVENGEGNISIARLAGVAEALGESASTLLAKAERPRPTVRPVITLLGLRGAGKSTLGARIAKDLGVPFVELDALVASKAGMSLTTLFELHGEAYFRRLERALLTKLLDEDRRMVLAAGGSIVTDDASFALLKSRTTTVWLKASAQDHWDRVVQQGDVRPMRNRADAMSELKALLRSRRPLYAQAEHVLDTSDLTLPEAAQGLKEIVGPKTNPIQSRNRNAPATRRAEREGTR